MSVRTTDIRSTLAALFLSGASIAAAQTYQATVLYPLADIGQNPVQPRQVTTNGAVGYDTIANSPANALLWSPPTGALTNLDPTNLGPIASAQALGISGGQQVGSFLSSASGSTEHAVLWTGSSSSAVDLNPSQLSALGSQAVATDGAQQVGSGSFGTPTSQTNHALLWSGTAASAVDLNPTGLATNPGSIALGVGGGQEVGDYTSSTTPTHAVLWTGSASSAVDLQPSDPTLEFSEAIGTSGMQQVGAARASGGFNQAFLWFGTAASAVNLNPTTLTGINASIAVASNGSQQVGSGFDGAATTDDDQALVWSGNASSVVDLQPFLPSSGSWDFSDAMTVDDAGNVFGAANGTFNGRTGYFAIEWSPVPEPASLSLLAGGCLLLARGRRCDRSPEVN